MARRHGRRKKDAIPTSRPDSPTRAGDILKTFLITALAMGISAVFFIITLDTASMVSAFRGVEYVRLLGENEAGARGSGPTWSDAYTELQTQLKSDPITRQHQAIAQMLKLVIASHDGIRPAADALKDSDPAFVTDVENRLTRLARWGLEDLSNAEKQTATQRFLLARSIFKSKRSITTSALYNDNFTRHWHEIVRKFVHRPDSAANYTLWLEHARTTDHFRALPILQKRMSELRASLLEEGHIGAADQCTTWLVESFRGLMQTERDSGTRLLCVDLIARTLGTSADATHLLKRLRYDFHADADRSPPDLAAPEKTPCVDPDGYLAAVRALVASVAFLTQGLGAVLMLGAAVWVGIARRFMPRGTIHDAMKRSKPLWIGTTAVVMCLAPAWLAARSMETALYSQTATLMMMVWVAALGAAIVLLAAAWRGPSTRASLSLAATWVVCCVLLLTIPAWRYAVAATYLGGQVAAPLIVSALVALMTAVCLSLSVVDALNLARTAAVTWLLASVLSVAALCVHLYADGKYLQQVAALRMDEFTARLGADWEDRYLSTLATAAASSAAPAGRTAPEN